MHSARLFITLLAWWFTKEVALQVAFYRTLLLNECMSLCMHRSLSFALHRSKRVSLCPSLKMYYLHENINHRGIEWWTAICIVSTCKYWWAKLILPTIHTRKQFNFVCRTRANLKRNMMKSERNESNRIQHKHNHRQHASIYTNHHFLYTFLFIVKNHETRNYMAIITTPERTRCAYVGKSALKLSIICVYR